MKIHSKKPVTVLIEPGVAVELSFKKGEDSVVIERRYGVDDDLIVHVKPVEQGGAKSKEDEGIVQRSRTLSLDEFTPASSTFKLSTLVDAIKDVERTAFKETIRGFIVCPHCKEHTSILYTAGDVTWPILTTHMITTHRNVPPDWFRAAIASMRKS